MKRMTAPLSREDALSLRAGEQILLSGTVYTARDAAHLRMLDLIREGKPLPIDLEGQVIYYAGPTPTPEGKPVGSIGPTTSVRMDAMTPTLLSHGLRGMIGKGGPGRFAVGFDRLWGNESHKRLFGRLGSKNAHAQHVA